MSTPSQSVEPDWINEKDWLCLLRSLREYDGDERNNGVNIIAFFLWYSQMTNTRMLALVSEKRRHSYELLFSFTSQDNKRRFFGLLQSNKITQVASDQIFVPTEDEIRDARPLATVLPKDVVQQLVVVTLDLGRELESFN